MTSPGLTEGFLHTDNKALGVLRGQLIVIRAVMTELEEEAAYRAESRGAGLDAWLGKSGGGGVSVELHVLRVRRVGLLVQRLPEENVRAAWEPVLQIERMGEPICRFHEGPWGEPEKHRYCTRRAVTRDGYCEIHKRSWRALYEKCAQGVDSACVSVAPLLRGYEFTVYVLDYGGSIVKAGLTQSWRLLWRISEQPHVAAAAVFHGGLLDARELEKRLGRSSLATEGAAARMNKRIESSVTTLRRLLSSPEKIATRLASLLYRLGLRGDYRAYTVLPRSRDPGWVTGSKALRPEELVGKNIRILDYWAGYLLVETGQEKGIVHKTSLQHVALSGAITS